MLHGCCLGNREQSLEVRQVVTSVMSAYSTALIRVVCPLTILFWPPPLETVVHAVAVRRLRMC